MCEDTKVGGGSTDELFKKPRMLRAVESSRKEYSVNCLQKWAWYSHEK